jgi:hypothetical protein
MTKTEIIVGYDQVSCKYRGCISIINGYTEKVMFAKELRDNKQSAISDALLLKLEIECGIKNEVKTN